MIVVDLFAGGGGASTGIEAALGRPVDVAINHDPVALKVHAANHPDTRHLTADVWDVKPIDATRGRPVALLWASPDCKHFSVAKGGVPRSKNIRSLANVVVDWARDVRPLVICLENVQEFRGWGPLLDNGQPCPKRKGDEFRAWKSSLERLGYVVDHRILDASEYGAPTKRLRLFLIARCDGRPIRWPAPTHGHGLLPLRTAGDCIDWSLPCPSIFTRKKPLVEKTRWRISKGLRTFVFEHPSPYIVPGGAAFIAKHYGDRGQRPGSGLDEPLSTITAADHNALVVASLVKFRGDNYGSDLHLPTPTVTAGGNHLAEVRAFLIAYYGDDATGGQSLFDPLRTITTRDRLGLVAVHGSMYQLFDIGMRMLQPHELLAAQFGRFAANYDLSAASTKGDKVRLIGNSVCPEVAEAIVRANVPQALAVAA